MKIAPFLLAFALGALAATASAQYALDWYEVSGGGGSSSGGQYSLTGTIGQHDAGVMAGGNYSLSGGFLSIPAAAPTAPAILSATLSAGLPNGTITLAWSATPGQTYQVQYKTSLSQPDWTNLATVTATNSTATVSDALDSSAQRFYRTVWLP